MKWNCGMRGHTTLGVLVALALAPICRGQKPVISPGGVVNAADYAGGILTPGSIASIFGQNLATTTLAATSTPLPAKLGGTTVTIEGLPAPLFFVSPNQIDLQYPSAGPPGTVVVTTTAGASDPYQSAGTALAGIGIFTQDASGCGPAAALNVASDGSVSRNSPSNSVSPGDDLEVFGTGQQYLSTEAPATGIPAPASPLVAGLYNAGGVYDFTWADPTGEAYYPVYNWAGLAPGQIGVDQFNSHVPMGVREGCAVPLRFLSTNGSITEPVTVAIRTGGGSCVDPPEQGYGQITWQKAENIAESGAITETDSVMVSLQESPGRQGPLPPAFSDTNSIGGTLFIDRAEVIYGPSCPVPGYRSLDAGTLTMQVPGAAPAPLPSAPLQQGQVGGLAAYQAALPAGTIQGGSFTVSATGGADVGAFQSTVQIGAEPHFTTDLTKLVVGCNGSAKISWTGGDPAAWVTVYNVFPGVGSTAEFYEQIGQARASDGYVVVSGNFIVAGANPCTYDGANMVIEVDPDPSEIPAALPAPGLSLGGQNTWKYLYYFLATVGG
jgi:uncharacterized protein (TIGR03437 family)